MPDPDPERLSEVFEAVLSLPPGARSAALERACGADLRLRDELTSLLASYRKAPDFLEDLPTRVLRRSVQTLVEETLQPHPLGARYEILERLGGGGMSVVYRARDRRLERLVVLKLLPPHLSADERARARLLREARAASVLDHPNIAVVHEIDESDAGQLFISMACHEGETLRDRLQRGPLPPEQAVELARQMASALSATHRAGIVHRDIKPSNVLVTTDGVVKILDFGIAKAAGSELTREGVIVGTVSYMSPEQTRSEVTDPRTDVWAVGAVLYEMLVGERPFHADSTDALIHSIRHDTPPSPDALRSDVAPVLARIVDRCLAKDPASRFESADALLAALSALKTARGRSRGARGTGRPAPIPIRIAILPLAADRADAESSNAADALTWELTSCLSLCGGLRVSALAAVLGFRERPVDPQQAARELGVQALVRGRLERRPRGILLQLELFAPGRGEPLWSYRWQGGPAGFPPMERRVVRRIAAALGARIQPTEQRRLVARGSANEVPEGDYLTARALLQTWDEGSAGAAADLFRTLVERRPGFSQAWSGLGKTYQVLAGVGALPAADAYPLSRAAAERALEVNDEIAEAHTTLGTAFSYHFLDPRSAEHHFRRAVELDPSDAAAHGFLAELLRNEGRIDEALQHIRIAQALNPFSPSHAFEEGLILYVGRRYDAAVERLRRLHAAFPEFHVVHFGLALALVQRHRYQEALSALEVLDPRRQSPDGLSLRGYVHAVNGRVPQAREMLGLLRQALAQPGFRLDASPFHAAVVHVGLGEMEEALDLLEELTRQRTWHAGLLKVEPMLDPLRTHPRFQRLLEELGLIQPPPLLTPISRPR